MGCGTKDFTVRNVAVRVQAKRALLRFEEVVQPACAIFQQTKLARARHLYLLAMPKR